MKPKVGDLAGVAYWDQVWSAPAKSGFDPSALANRKLAGLMRRFLKDVPAGGFVLEAGCGDSVVTAFVANLGYRTGGIDYSLAGCEKFRRNAPGSAVYHADVLNPPARLVGNADAVFSLGMVEHFSDTKAIIDALARLVKPGGHILTVVPNMWGTVGALQKALNRAAYDVHVPLSPDDLRASHSGLAVIDAGYLGSVSYGVVNPGQSLLSRAVIAVLSRLSLGVMAIENAVPLPCSRSFSPYCYCLARI